MTRIKSTRDSIQGQFITAVKRCDQILERFQRADELADGKSPVLDQYLPGLVEAVSHFKNILDNIRKEL